MPIFSFRDSALTNNAVRDFSSGKPRHWSSCATGVRLRSPVLFKLRGVFEDTGGSKLPTVAHAQNPSRRCRTALTIMTVTIMTVVVAGCRSEVPGPKTGSPPNASTSISSTETTSVSTPNGPAEAPFEIESDFLPLSLDQFDTFDAQPTTWSATADGIACSGKPRGYLYSKKPYQNFTWRLEYRFLRPENLNDEAKFKGNTGFLVYITGEHKLWPMCLEVQGKHLQMAAVKENGGAQPVAVEDNDTARQQARKPVGQWNAIEIVSKEGELKVTLNGTPIAKSQPDFLSEGSIGIQAEDHPFEIRQMRIRID